MRKFADDTAARAAPHSLDETWSRSWEVAGHGRSGYAARCSREGPARDSGRAPRIGGMPRPRGAGLGSPSSTDCRARRRSAIGRLSRAHPGPAGEAPAVVGDRRKAFRVTGSRRRWPRIARIVRLGPGAERVWVPARRGSRRARGRPAAGWNRKVRGGRPRAARGSRRRGPRPLRRARVDGDREPACRTRGRSPHGLERVRLLGRSVREHSSAY